MKTVKDRQMDILADYVRGLYRKPDLRQLFLELTLQCNEHCFHCGSNCMPHAGEELSLSEYRRILDEVKEDFDLHRIFLCITGGEPLLRPDFFDILGYANKLGFRWGMTTNATLITKSVAHKLAECGMKTVSVSVDGLPDTHDRLRGLPGGYDAAMQGIQNLIDEHVFQNVQVTTVINHENITELDALFRVMDDLDIDSWRVINLEPIGRALQWPSRMLTEEDYKTLFAFIREKRRAGYPVEYGCSHYLKPFRGISGTPVSGISGKTALSCSERTYQRLPNSAVIALIQTAAAEMPITAGITTAANRCSVLKISCFDTSAFRDTVEVLPKSRTN